MSEQVGSAVRARLDEYEEAWLWHDATDELLAGYGYHMMQLIHRLPADGQTLDMARVERLAQQWSAGFPDEHRAADLLSAALAERGGE